MANLNKENIPKHVAIIMDGNGRWAIENSFKISEGDLILFTPDQKHLAPRSTQKHDELRISLSFNVTLPFIPSGDA